LIWARQPAPKPDTTPKPASTQERQPGATPRPATGPADQAFKRQQVLGAALLYGALRVTKCH